MIGKYNIEIGQKEFLDGITSSPETEDGGFSPETSGVNITSSQTTLGILYAPSDVTDKSTNLNGNIIASCSDADQGIGVARYILTSTGRFQEVSSSGTITNRQSGAKTYSFPNSDMVVYKNKLYATSSTDITEASGATLGTIDEVWWTTTKSKQALGTGFSIAHRHPLLVYEDSLWIGDGNMLHKWDGTTATGQTGSSGTSFLTLNKGVVIIALGVDPGTGKMLIVGSEGPNGSDTLPRQCKIYVWDGFSAKPSRAVIVDDMVTEIYPLGGVTYMFYGQNIGYWNGSGITFLRKLRSVTLSGTSLVYKHRVTNIGKTLMIADGVNILCFEETLPGQKRWYVNLQQNSSFNNYLDAIFNMGSNVLGIGYDSNGSTPQFCVFDRSARTAGAINFYSKKYKFPRPIYVREIHVEYLDQVPTTATTGTIILRDQNFTNIATPALTNDSSGSTFEITRTITSNKKIRTLQLNYSNAGYTSTVAGIRRILVNYDVVE